MFRSRRFTGVIAFVLIWSLVLVVPSLRVLWQAQMGEIAGGRSSVLDRIISGGNISDGLDTLEARYPNDLRVKVAAELPSDNLQQLHFYDDLLARYSDTKGLSTSQYDDATWLLAARMRATTSDQLIPNAAIGDYGVLPGSTPGAPPTHLKDSSPWLSPAEMGQSLRIAELGNQHDPQNAFYDWMRAALYFGLHQPQDAVTALQAGAKKTRFDDGVLRQGQINDAVAHLRGRTVWEGRIAINAAMLFPHYALLRNVTRAANWQAILARRAGNEGRAIAIFDAVQRGGALMRHDTSTAIGALVAEAMERMVWSAAVRGATIKKYPHPPTHEDARKRILSDVRQFAAQAQRVGQSSTGEFALQEASAFDALALARRSTNFTEFSLLMGDGRFFFAAQWLGGLLLLCTAAALCAWASESVCLAWQRAPHGADDITRTDAVACALFCLPATALAVIIAMKSGAGNFVAYFGYDAGVDVSVTDIAFRPVAALVMSWLPVLLTLGYAVVAALWRTRKTRALAPRRPFLPRLLKVLGVIVGIGLFAFITSVWELPLSANALNGWLHASQTVSWLLCVPLFFLVRWWARHRTVKVQAPSAGIHTLYALEWHRRAVGILVLLFSFGYLLTSLSALPARQRADATFDRYVLKGEAALARESLEQVPPTTSETADNA